MKMVIKLAVTLLLVACLAQALADVPTGKWFYFKSKATHKCLFYDATSKEIKQGDCSETAENQKWEIQPSQKNKSSYNIKNTQGKVFDIQWGSKQNGGKVWTYDLNNTPAQNFKFENRNGVWSVQNQGSLKCLDVPGSNAANNLVMIQWTCHTGNNQMWEISKIGEKKASAANPNPEGVPLDKFVQLKNKNSQKCLYTHAYSKELKQRGCNDKDESQKFKITVNKNKPGLFYIFNNQGKAMDVQYGNKNNGAKLWAHDQNFTPAQNFKIYKKNGWHVVNTQSNKCLDDDGWKKDDDITMIQWDCHYGNNQGWDFIEISADKPKPSGQNPSGQQPAKPSGLYPASSGIQPAEPSGQQPTKRSAQQPSTPSSQQPVKPSVQQPSTPSGQQPSTPSGQQPTNPSGQQPSTPSGQQPTTPSGQQPTNPSGQQPSHPSGQKPSTPSGQQPSGQQISTPSGQSPQRKEDNQPSQDDQPKNLPPKLTEGMYSQKGYGKIILT